MRVKTIIMQSLLVMTRAEVTDTMLKEYDEVFHIECEKKISREEGRAEGRAEGREEGRAEERANTDKERLRADVAEQKVEAAEQKLEIFKLRLQGKTKEEIADIKGISLEKVEKILSEE